MLPKFISFVKGHLDDIILVVGVILISMLSFAAGYIAAKQQEKEPIQIETNESGNSGSGNLRVVSCLETV